jgi:hypothetical protein
MAWCSVKAQGQLYLYLTFVYHNNTRNMDELKISITNIIADISPLTLQAVSANILHCARVYMRHVGAHLQNFLSQDISLTPYFE